MKAHDHLENRRLLWHGTNVAVVAAILKSGLRIMPHSGGRVGKGLYFASENGKSMGYGKARGCLVWVLSQPSTLPPPPLSDPLQARGDTGSLCRASICLGTVESPGITFSGPPFSLLPQACTLLDGVAQLSVPAAAGLNMTCQGGGIHRRG